MPTRVYTTSEVCAMLRCDPSTLSRYVKAGYLVRVMRGKYTITSVERLLEEGVPCQSDEPRAKDRSGTTKPQSNGVGASRTKAKNTLYPPLIGRGRAKNAID